MPRRERCIFGCNNFDVLHRFPKPKYPSLDRFKQWVEIVGVIKENVEHSDIYDNYRICDKHFESRYFYPHSKRLSRTALPSLKLISQAPVHFSGWSSVEPHRIPLQERELNTEEFVQRPSTSTETCDKTVTASTDLHVAAKKKMFRPKQDYRITKLLEKISKLKIKLKMCRNEIKAAKKMSKTKLFNKVLCKLPLQSKTFLMLQLQQIKKKSKGRRFSLNEKLLALAIFKRSPRGYNFLQRLFVLPQKRTLQNLLKLISIKPGINLRVFNEMKITVAKLSEEKRMCTLIFDEMSLSPGLLYDKSDDEIIGFENFGKERTDLIADHLCVFMVKGIKSNYKQPVSYMFCKDGIKYNILKQHILELIVNIKTTGLKIVSTICDQGSTFRRLIKELLNDTKQNYLRKGLEWKNQYFEIEGMQIFPLFDPPHLLKGIRNNLITKDLQFIEGGKRKIAKWSHLKLLLDLDVGEDELRMVNKLTESHIVPQKIPKMKVKHAAQVFSQRVQGALRFCAKHNLLPKECLDTADLLLIFDRLFDSFNGHCYKDSSKIYKVALKLHSPHFKLWSETLAILKSMKYIKIERSGLIKYVQVPTIKSWIHNLCTMEAMFKYLNKEQKVTSLLTRNFNQDPLENFFSIIRSQGCRNTSPTCSQLEKTYKALLVNCITSQHSINANCEEDQNEFLQPLQFLIAEGEENAPGDNGGGEDVNIDPLLNFLCNYNVESGGNVVKCETKNYVAGYVIKKCKAKICKTCNTCNLNLSSTSPPQSDSYIFIRDYTKKSLHYPSSNLIKCLNEIYKIIMHVLQLSPFTDKIASKIKFFVELSIDFTFLTCGSHKEEIKNYVIHLATLMIIYSWCTNVNRLLNGKHLTFDRDDKVKLQAFDYYEKKKKK